MICAVVDNRISEACRSRLAAEGFKVILLSPDKRLSEAVASHTDMLIARVDKNIVINRDYAKEHSEIIEEIRASAPEYNIIVDNSPMLKDYPNDCIYNCLVTNDKIYTRNTENESISTLAKASGRALQKIKQGYPACTTLMLGNTHAITADEGMARVLSSDGISVTLIENGDISLPPYEYGFIGGACGACGDTVYFCGDVSAHRSFEKIADAIKRAGMKYVSLSFEKLSDLGGILFL